MEINQLYISMDGTSFLDDVYFKHKDYSSLYKVGEAIKEVENYIQYEKDQLKIMIALPTEALQKEANFEGTTLRYNINNTVNDAFETLYNLHTQLYKLYRLRNLFEMENGEKSIEIVKNDKI